MVVPASLDIDNKDESFKEDLMFVSVSSADKDAEKTFDSFNRMHMTSSPPLAFLMLSQVHVHGRIPWFS